MPNVMAALPNIGGALCESSVIRFLVPRRNVWLTPAQSINQSKFIFQVITENYNVINSVALKGLPEKHHAHLDWSPEQKNNTSINTSEKGKRQEEKLTSACAI